MGKTLGTVLMALGIILIATSAIALVSFASFLSNIEQTFNLGQTFVAIPGINISTICIIGIVIGIVLLIAGVFMHRKAGSTPKAPNTQPQPPAQPPQQPTPETNPEMPAS